MRRFAPVFAVGFMAFPLFAQAPPPAAQSQPMNQLPASRIVADVADDVTLLSGDSLPFDPTLNPKPNAELYAHSNASGLLDAKEVETRGMRQWRFVLKPKETIKFRLEGVPPGKMEFLLDMPPLKEKDPLFPQIRRLNRFPKDSRQTRYDFSNSLETPYTIVMALIGRIDLPFKVRIDRSGGRP